MKIIVVGLGETGKALIKLMDGSGHDITVIDMDHDKVDAMTDKYRVNGVTGSAASARTLKSAGAETADVLVALTHTDEINLLSCMQAKAAGTKQCIARILMPDLVAEEEALKERYGIDYFVKPRADLADEIFMNIGLPGHVKLEPFGDESAYLLDMNVIAGSPVIDVSVRSLREDLCPGIRIDSIMRGKHPQKVSDPYVFEEGDGLVIKIPAGGSEEILKTLGIVRHAADKIVVVGGGIAGGYLADKLCKAGKKLTILDYDLNRCRELMEAFPSARVSYAGGDITEVLDEEHVDRADAIVSLTDNDETNLVISMYAWSRGIPSVITRVDRQVHVKLLHKVNIDITISPTEISIIRILRYISSLARNKENTAQMDCF